MCRILIKIVYSAGSSLERQWQGVARPPRAYRENPLLSASWKTQQTISHPKEEALYTRKEAAYRNITLFAPKLHVLRRRERSRPVLLAALRKS